MQSSLFQFGHLSAIPLFSNCDVPVGTRPSGAKAETFKLFPSLSEIGFITSFANLTSFSQPVQFTQSLLQPSEPKFLGSSSKVFSERRESGTNSSLSNDKTALSLALTTLSPFLMYVFLAASII